MAMGSPLWVLRLGGAPAGDKPRATTLPPAAPRPAPHGTRRFLVAATLRAAPCDNPAMKLSRIPRGWLFALAAALYVVFGAIDRLTNGDPPLLVLEATALRALIYGAIAAGGYLLYRRF